ncbi:MAG: MFS transporter [Acidobacteriota bacterium]|nr:MFS transporter [Acidobacteriota bacterium]
MMATTTALSPRPTRVRYLMLAMLFLASTFSYGDRVVLSIAGISFSRDLHLDPLHMGYLFSGFSWAYVAAQLPSGGLLDRFGTRPVYGFSIIAWSLCAVFAGLAGFLGPALAFTAIFALRLLSGLAQAPVFPGNGRVVAAWFPTRERGTASAIFNSSQYFAVVLFAPVMAWITHTHGWKGCFWFLGLLGLLLALLWFRLATDVAGNPRINATEVELIQQGGGLGSIGPATRASGSVSLTWATLGHLLRNRMLLGIYLGQYCIVTLTWFFLTWFPLYLSQARHMSLLKVGFVATLPALCGSIGGISGGVFSDRLLRRGHSLSLARKTPIILGMSLSMTMIACNYLNTQWLIVLLMSLAFFGKGFGALGWTVISDTSPRGMIGINGSVFNLIGNLAGITTPILIGYIVQRTGSFQYALLFVAAMALLAIVAYLPIVGTIRRLEPQDIIPTHAQD